MSEQTGDQHPIIFDDLSQRDLRALMFNVLYSMDSWDYDSSLESILHTYDHGFGIEIPLSSSFVETIRDIIQKRDELDTYYKPLLSNWRFDRISVPTKIILRYAVWELLYTEVDHRIVINEAIELAKSFAEDDAYRFINGILDKLVQQLERKQA